MGPWCDVADQPSNGDMRFENKRRSARLLVLTCGGADNYHATNRTSGNDLFIYPLMMQDWTFQSSAVVRRMAAAIKPCVRWRRIARPRATSRVCSQRAAARPG